MNTTSHEQYIVQAEELCVRFGDFYAVKNVSFAVKPGEIFGFLGANGAGKTTTIRVLCGLLVPTSGRVFVDGQPMIKGQEHIIKQKVGYMSQRFTLYKDLTIAENLEFAATLRQIPPKIFQERRQKLFDFIEFNQKPNIIVSELPGGIKQEIALIASILHQPRIIFLDEPTAGVAPNSRARFWELIKRLANDGNTIFVTTHYMDEAENCHRIALMRSGELIALDSPTNLKQDTFDQPIYLISPTTKKMQQAFLTQATPYFSVLEPYGQHFHAIIKPELDEAAVIAGVAQYCSIKKVEPSLEDVFVKLVEGTTR